MARMKDRKFEFSEHTAGFMVNIQRLLDGGLFTASYRFALLLALAGLSIEQGDDCGEALDLRTDAIAEKFVLYYWRQVVPWLRADEMVPLAAAWRDLIRP
jgi:hypothetical protein